MSVLVLALALVLVPVLVSAPWMPVALARPSMSHERVRVYVCVRERASGEAVAAYGPRFCLALHFAVSLNSNRGARVPCHGDSRRSWSRVGSLPLGVALVDRSTPVRRSMSCYCLVSCRVHHTNTTQHGTRV